MKAAPPAENIIPGFEDHIHALEASGCGLNDASLPPMNFDLLPKTTMGFSEVVTPVIDPVDIKLATGCGFSDSTLPPCPHIVPLDQNHNHAHPPPVPVAEPLIATKATGCGFSDATLPPCHLTESPPVAEPSVKEEAVATPQIMNGCGFSNATLPPSPFNQPNQRQ